MREENKNFLERLQSADESMKFRWLIGSSFVFVIIVVYVWLAYFNNLITQFSVNTLQPVAEPSGEPAQGGTLTFLDAMKNGTAIIYNFFDDKLHFLGKILETPREFIVKPPN